MVLGLCPVPGITQTSDTLRVNFSIATSEFGSSNEGLFLYEDDEGLKAKYVLYKATSYGLRLPLDSSRVKVEDIDFYREQEQKYMDLLVKFYNENRHNYIVLKDECLLDSIQKAYIIGVLDIIRTYRYEGEDLYISNAPDYYTIMSENGTYTLYDPYKKLKEYIELRKTLNVQYPPGTRHYVDIM